jgi:formylglycine-generating enzyme required for sulfatase activity
MSKSAAELLRDVRDHYVAVTPAGQLRIEHPLVVNARDGSILVYVPAGAFEMGDGQDSDCPQHRVELSAYWIGVYAVSNAQYLKFVQATGHRVPANERHRDSALADHAVTDVDWNDSVAYAQWAGCELASDAQWEKACRGPLGFIYPWGNNWDATKCRHNSNRGSETTCAVYGYAQGASGYGTYNQSGNVWEWCGDWYGEKYYGESPSQDPRGPAGGSNRVSRGGSWRYDDPGNCRGAYRYWYDPGFRNVRLGLRLVRAAS